MTIIEGLVREAKGLFAAHSSGLLGDEGIRNNLSEYQEKITATNSLMQHADIVKTCSACAAEKMGSCCMQDVEEWYDPMLLLINLLMGAEFPETRELSGHCIFVGDHGCKLIARYPFCVNYLCPRLKELLGPSQTQRLMTVAGQELLSGWEAEISIRNWLSNTPSRPGEV